MTRSGRLCFVCTAQWAELLLLKKKVWLKKESIDLIQPLILHVFNLPNSRNSVPSKGKTRLAVHLSWLSQVHVWFNKAFDILSCQNCCAYRKCVQWCKASDLTKKDSQQYTGIHIELNNCIFIRIIWIRKEKTW